MAAAAGYDAFISYSHQHDKLLGPALQAGLERFATPWYRPGTLRVFRDEASLSASTALWPSIEEALQSSDWFILLASPAAASSEWVDREVRWWLDHHGTERLLVLGTGPGLAWDERRKDWAAGAPVPPSLRGVFGGEPRWVDLTGTPRRRGVPAIPAERLAEVAAPIRGLSKDMMIGEHLRKHRHAMRLAWGAAAFLLVAAVSLAVVAVVAIRARQQAIGERNLAVSSELISQSGAVGDTDPALSRLLSVAAWRIEGSSAAYYTMLTAAELPGIAILPGSEQVETVAFSPDGKTLASVDLFNAVRLWDVADRRLAATPFGGETEIDAVAFSPDGRFLAGADTGDGVTRLWDVSARRQVRTFTNGSTDATTAVAFSPDGKILATGYGGGQVRLWDVMTGQQIGAPLPASLNGDSVDTVAFNPDGRTLAVSSGFGMVQLWDAATRRRICGPLEIGTATVRAAAFSPDGKILATAGDDGAVQPWNVATCQQVTPLNGDTSTVTSLAFSPDGKILATAGSDGMVRLWDLTTRQQLGNPFNGDAGPVTSVAFSPDGQILASGNSDGTVRLWDVARLLGTTTLTSRNIPGGPVGALAFSPDGRTLAGGSSYGVVRWQVTSGQQSGRLLITARGANGVTAVAFSPDGKTLATATDADTLLWDAASGRQIGSPLLRGRNYGGTVTPVTFSPDGELLAAAVNSEVLVWNAASHIRIRTLSPPVGDAMIGALAFSPDGTILAATTGSDTYLWDTATWKQIGGPLAGPSNLYMTMAFSPDGDILAVGAGTTVQLWYVATRQQIGHPFISINNPDDTGLRT